MVHLEILEKETAVDRRDVESFPFSIGRGAQAHLRLKSPGIWDHHAEIHLQSSHAFHLHAVGDAIVTLNDEPVDKVPLRNGDLIGLGSVKIRFGLRAAPSRPFLWRERLTWIGIGLLCLGQVALIYWLPG